MALEIERKYLVVNDTYKSMATEELHIKQGYLSSLPTATVRVRTANDHGYITVKSKNKGMVRSEWEYEVPKADADQMLTLCHTALEKVRYKVPYHGYVWEIDEFGGKLGGLVLAEIELPSPEAEFDIPPFIGEEVTGNPYYYNSNLARIG